MAQKIKVGAVSYLNTKPLIYGFDKVNMKHDLDIIFDYPSNIASLLINDQIDVGLIPVAVIPKLAEYHIVSDYCIACDGEVASVCLFSDVPLQEIKTILLDYQSRTSAALLKILLQEHWNIDPALIAGSVDFENDITGTTAGLVIGDRALNQRLRSKYIYDLGSAWKEMTGLPFVFAAWVSNKQLPEDFMAEFNQANAEGFKHLDEVIRDNPFPAFDLENYYTEKVKFILDADKYKAMGLFLSKLERHVEAIP